MIRVAICDDDISFTGSIEEQLHTLTSSLSIPLKQKLFGSSLLAELHRGIRYDIIFMDIEMPNIDGISVAKQLRLLDPAYA